MTALSDSEDRLPTEQERLDDLLDDALEDSFPASDPIGFLRRESV